MSQLLCKLIIM